MTEPQNTSRELIVGFIAMIVTFGASDTFQKDLEPVVGYVGSVAGSIVISAIIVLIVCLVGKLRKPKIMAISTLLPPTLVTFEQVRMHSITMTGSGFLSLVLAIAAALAVGFVVGFLVKQVTGVDWGMSAEEAGGEPKSTTDA